jgi:hypothetical protein
MSFRFEFIELVRVIQLKRFKNAAALFLQYSGARANVNTEESTVPVNPAFCVDRVQNVNLMWSQWNGSTSPWFGRHLRRSGQIV